MTVAQLHWSSLACMCLFVVLLAWHIARRR